MNRSHRHGAGSGCLGTMEVKSKVRGAGAAARGGPGGGGGGRGGLRGRGVSCNRGGCGSGVWRQEAAGSKLAEETAKVRLGSAPSPGGKTGGALNLVH